MSLTEAVAAVPATGTTADRPPVHELVSRFARLTPRHPAVRSGDATIGYGGLDAWAARIAARLAAAGVGRGDRVAILAAPGTAMVAGALGILKSGAAYVPVDRALPDHRVTAVLADARVSAVVVTADLAHRVGGDVPVVRAEDAEQPDDGDQDDEPEGSHPDRAASPADPAYLIYTSGTTGEPKGVLVEHAQLSASTAARAEVYPEPGVFLLVSPLAFDSSVAGLWGTLTTGGTLVVARPEEVTDPERLLGLVDRHAATRLLCVPSLYSVLLDAAERTGTAALRSLRTVIMAGEPLPQTLLDRHFRLLRDTGLVNEYGPTEATVWASYRRYTEPAPVTIGRAVPGVSLYVLDERGEPVPDGTEGELYIGGEQVARGYFGRPEATGAAFPPDPHRPGGRRYRTGDLVVRRPDATLDFRGRGDHQVKIRGHRVELGAVEEELRALPGVRDAAVVPDAGRTLLTGFVRTEPGTDPAALRQALARRLPDAMVPARLLTVDVFPLTVNGKVDRAALAERAERTPMAAPEAPAAQGDTTAQVAAAWAEVLKLPSVPLDVNFFDLGGHSLTMYQLQTALESRTGVRPSVVSLFRHTTVTTQAALLAGGAEDGRDDAAAGRREAAARRVGARRARRSRDKEDVA
ncbi:non-ribosomal peptide synthetase [Streptomyces bauhiniae]|uniref:non-ribosomal peptide synthetase n=1 Tax=Streptomyces bauhiniae TaxID=2340725 RepID=UPI003330EF14